MFLKDKVLAESMASMAVMALETERYLSKL